MESLHDRLTKSYDFLLSKGLIHTQTQFAEALGRRQADVSSALNGNPKRCTLGLMKTIAAAYSDYLNEDWLLTGEGEMAKPDRSLKPHFHAKAAAGFMAGLLDAESGEDKRDRIPGLPEYDFTIEAAGDSMLPRIEDGDLLACRNVTDHDNFDHVKGRICVVASKDGAAVKVITAVRDDSIVCHSLNPAYPDYDVAFTDILGIALVVGAVRRF